MQGLPGYCVFPPLDFSSRLCIKATFTFTNIIEYDLKAVRNIFIKSLQGQNEEKCDALNVYVHFNVGLVGKFIDRGGPGVGVISTLSIFGFSLHQCQYNTHQHKTIVLINDNRH